METPRTRMARSRQNQMLKKNATNEHTNTLFFFSSSSARSAPLREIKFHAEAPQAQRRRERKRVSELLLNIRVHSWLVCAEVTADRGGRFFGRSVEITSADALPRLRWSASSKPPPTCENPPPACKRASRCRTSPAPSRTRQLLH